VFIHRITSHVEPSTTVFLSLSFSLFDKLRQHFEIIQFTALLTKLSSPRIATEFPEQRALLGSLIDLPCNVSHRSDDRLQMLLFYKRNDSDVASNTSSNRTDNGRTLATGPPIFTLDMRSSSNRLFRRSADNHQSLPSSDQVQSDQPIVVGDQSFGAHPLSPSSQFVAPPFSGRVSFNWSRPDGLFSLQIRQLSELDAGQYICRSDFKWSRTLLSLVSLYVVGKCITPVILLYSYFFFFII
jgi:hypothetical protein